jgi:hypothetical protein
VYEVYPAKEQERPLEKRPHPIPLAIPKRMRSLIPKYLVQEILWIPWSHFCG